MNENWLEVFDAYDVQFLVLGSQEDGDMIDLFRSQPDWRVDSEDGEAIIFARVAAAWGHGNPIHAEGDTREDQMV